MTNNFSCGGDTKSELEINSFRGELKKKLFSRYFTPANKIIILINIDQAAVFKNKNTDFRKIFSRTFLVDLGRGNR